LSQNQWGELSIDDVDRQLYGRPLSTIFGRPGKDLSFAVDDDLDPMVDELRALNYRYVRLFFHPIKDRFVLFNGWRDPNWADTRAVRAGIDTENKGLREVVFGPNLIDIEQKSIPRLLVDEVS
jgi:cation-transporting P-type ATPase 13A2